MRSRSRRVSSAPGRSALLITNTSAISSRPALLACTESPQPGFTTTTVVSAAPATSTSTWPTPTVSITIQGHPAASRTRTASRVASESPPRWPRVAIERMNTPSSVAWSDIRTRSPRMAPPREGRRRVDGEHGDRVALSPGDAQQGVGEGRLAGAGRAGDADRVGRPAGGVGEAPDGAGVVAAALDDATAGAPARPGRRPARQRAGRRGRSADSGRKRVCELDRSPARRRTSGRRHATGRRGCRRGGSPRR